MSQSVLLTDASVDYFERTSSPLLDINAAHTVCFWVRANSNVTLFYPWCPFASFGAYDAIYAFGSGASGAWQLECTGGSGGTSAANGGTVNVGDWYHVALIREDATTLRLWVRPEGGSYTNVATCTTDVSGRSAIGTMLAGNFLGLGGGFNLDGNLAYMRAWAAELNLTEVDAESVSPTPVRTSDLWEDWPFDAVDFGDGAANGRHFSKVGSPAADDGPPEVVDPGGGGGTARRLVNASLAGRSPLLRSLAG